MGRRSRARSRTAPLPLRRAITPPAIVYGPVGVGTLAQRVQAVENGVGPRTVSSPGGGTSFTSASTLKSAITAAGGVASLFVCSVNIPPWTVNVDCGSVGHTVVFPGPVGQKIIDAAGAEIIGLQGTYTLKGGTWRNFGTASFGHGAMPGDDSVIEDAVFEACHYSGISIVGHRTRLSYCTLQNNGSGGVTTGTTGLNQANDGILEYCDVSGNNVDLNAPGGSPGGMGAKFLFVGRGHWHHNYFHGNFGPGLWPDTNNWGCLLENNSCRDNYWPGLFSEANYGNSIINNYIMNNGRTTVIGGAAATFDNTANVRLADNSADRTAPDGAVYPLNFAFNVIDHDRAPAGQTGGLLTLLDHSDSSTRHVANHDIHDNQWWIRNTNSIGGNISRIRAADTVSPDFQLWDLDNHFYDNEYRIPAGLSGSTFWQWDSGLGTGTPKTYAQWQAIHTGDDLALVEM